MKLKAAFRSFANARLISCLAQILDKNVACNYIVSVSLHKYVEGCVSLCIVAVASHVSDQGPAVWIYKRRDEKFQHCALSFYSARVRH